MALRSAQRAYPYYGGHNDYDYPSYGHSDPAYSCGPSYYAPYSRSYYGSSYAPYYGYGWGY